MTPRLPFLFLLCATVVRGTSVNVTNDPSLCIQLPGYTNHLYGTFTNQLRLTNSGTSGNKIVFLMEQDAKFSKPVFGGNNPVEQAAITTGLNLGVSFVVLDGGVNGLIINTSNGVGKAFATNSIGIYVYGVSDVEIKNFNISNTFTRVYGDICTDYLLEGIAMGNVDTSTNILIHNNRITSVLNGIQLYLGNHTSNYWCYSNSVINVNQAINVTTPAANGGDIWNSGISANYISLGTDFGGDGAHECEGSWHGDAIFINNGGSDSLNPTNHNFRIERNQCFSGGCTKMSGLINLTPANNISGWPGLLIANNLLVINVPTVVGPTTNLFNPIQALIDGVTVANNTIYSYLAGTELTVGHHSHTWNNALFNFGYAIHYQTTDWITNNPSIVTSSNKVWEPYWPRVVDNDPANTNQWFAMLLDFIGKDYYLTNFSSVGVGVEIDYNGYSSSVFQDGGFQVEPLGAGISVKPYFFEWTGSYKFDLHGQFTNLNIVNYAPSNVNEFAFGTNLFSISVTQDIQGIPYSSSGAYVVGAFSSTNYIPPIPPAPSNSYLYIPVLRH